MKIRTIIIDDELKSAMLLEKYLKPYSHLIHTVTTANDAQEGFAAIKKNKPDLIFLDISMPGSNGLNLLNRFAQKDFKVSFA